jgi:hypothetical protein
MCLTGRREVQLERVEAYKVFQLQPVLYRDRTLADIRFRSPFVKTDKVFPMNRPVRVDKEDANFFAFKEFDSAKSVVCGINLMENASLMMILPVTLHEVVAEGNMHSPSDDLQCMDGCYPAWEAKEIEVHNSFEARRKYYDAVLDRAYFHKRMYPPVRYELAFSLLEDFLQKRGQ